MRATYAPVGIVVAGSIVRGEAGPTSDFDVFVVNDEPWRLREQKRFAGVPAEIFVNPAAQVRRYFEREHAEGRPCTAHMFATGEVVEPSGPVITDLVAEAKSWLARPLEVTEVSLTQRRYGIVDTLDDARDTCGTDPAACAMLLADAAREIVAYAFWKRKQFQPRRKDAVRKLRDVDERAAALVRKWQDASDIGESLLAVEALASHVLGAVTFFAWTSPRDPIASE